MKVRKKPVIVEATPWFRNGDHPDDDVTRGGTTPNGEKWGGLIVRRFRHLDVSGTKTCQHCGMKMHTHGWIDTHGGIDTLEGGHVVCPGDWIITGAKGEHYPCKPDIFIDAYDVLGEQKGGV